MLRIAVTDLSAESRTLLEKRIRILLEGHSDPEVLLPRISLMPLAIEEIRFHALPDLCIIGPEVIERELPVIRAVRHAMPEVPIVAAVNRSHEGISTIEQLARLGVDDTLTTDVQSEEFLRKIILLGRRVKAKKGGSLILVDGGKGGLGVTSIAASFGDGCAIKGKKTLLVDLDFETQDLSRFLQARPFLNENLHLLLQGSRPVTQEFVDQCYVPVWHEDDKLFLMAPCADHDELYNPRASYARVLVSILEVLDDQFDVIVVDVGSVRGSLLTTMYRIADTVLFIADSDPATVYAGVDRLTRVRQWLAADASVILLFNEASRRRGLPRTVVQDEFIRAAKLQPESMGARPIPFSERGSRWPGSGHTLSNLGGSQTNAAVLALTEQVLLGERGDVEESLFALAFRTLRSCAHALLHLFDARSRGTRLRASGSTSIESLPAGSLRLPDLRGGESAAVESVGDDLGADGSEENDLLVSAPVLCDSERERSSGGTGNAFYHG